MDPNSVSKTSSLCNLCCAIFSYQVYDLRTTVIESAILDSCALGLLGLPQAYLANQRIMGLLCSGPKGLISGLPCQIANHLIPLLWACWADLGPTLPTSNHWFPSLWAYWAYLGPTFPTSKSLDSFTLGLLGLSRASVPKSLQNQCL